MEQQRIINNEQTNDGTLIHVYHDHATETWLAYGYSAFLLRVQIKSRGYDNLRSFSEELNMPCTMVSDISIRRLISSHLNVIEKQQDYIQLKSSIELNKKNYIRWADKLKDERSRKELMWVDTPVSKEVPKDTFIQDNMSSVGRNTKRLIDLFASGCALVIFSPLILICYIAVRLEDGGPAIYAQERIGRFGRPFKIYKFRSMRMDAEKMGPQLSHGGGENDPRLTKVGAFIRAHHLDELPQLWNVFVGDMAFVGPRPERQFYIDQIMEYDKRYSYLYQIRPGVTSYATLYNGYTDTMEKMLRRLEYDLYYLNHRTFWLDIKILFNTFCSIIFGKIF
jgi:lipopolysaccharide/colanic/teichoic acid biosynthesis glycosyltransferase